MNWCTSLWIPAVYESGVAETIHLCITSLLCSYLNNSNKLPPTTYVICCVGLGCLLSYYIYIIIIIIERHINTDLTVTETHATYMLAHIQVKLLLLATSIERGLHRCLLHLFE
jgi:uncharacterized protein with PQ loop repeat